MSNNIDYSRLSYLCDRMRLGIATKEEKDEYMLTLYQNGKISEVQYNSYIANRNSTEIVNAALSVGAVLLIGYVLSQIFKGR